MDTIKAANKVIREGLVLLPDEMKGDFKAPANEEIFIDEAINNACGAVNGDEEKIAMLKAYAVQDANRIASTLWREGLITSELEKEYRALPKMVDTAKEYNVFLDRRQARADELTEKNKALLNEKRDMDIFMGIVNGIPAAESEKRYDEFKNQQRAAMTGGK